MWYFLATLWRCTDLEMLFNFLLIYFSTWVTSCFTTLVRQAEWRHSSMNCFECMWLTAQTFLFIAWTLRGQGSVFVGSKLKSNYHKFYNNTSLLCVSRHKSQDFLRAGTEAKTNSCIIIGYHFLTYFCVSWLMSAEQFLTAWWWLQCARVTRCWVAKTLCCPLVAH